MNGSMWLLTATCLACGAPDPATAVPAQSGSAPRVIRISHPGDQDYANGTGGTSYRGPYDGPPVKVGNSCACDECPGLLVRLLCRLRAFFSRSHSDSCCETSVVQRGTSHPGVCQDCGDGGQHGLGLRQRLASLFHRPSPETPCCAPPQQVIVQMAPAPVLPSIQPTAPIQPPLPIQPVSNVPTRPAAPPAKEIAKEYLHRVGNADDYSWVTGQLFYIHIHSDQGLWFVRYAPVDKEDRYGGSVVLAPATSMANFREGDLVTVRGEILNQGRASRYLGGPLYRALVVELRERPRP
jgi:hypothetical protein